MRSPETGLKPAEFNIFTADAKNASRPESYTDDLELAEGLSAGNEGIPASCSESSGL